MAGRAFNQLDCWILCTHVSPDGMTWSHWLLAWRQVARREKQFQLNFFVGCDQACPYMLKAAHDCAWCSEASQELQYHWK